MASLKELCEEQGIIHELAISYASQQNGVAKRKNKTLKKMMTTMLASLGMPINM